MDGYNLYYGCLKGTAYKWLDLNALFEVILSSVLYQIDGAPAKFEFGDLRVKYCTAPILQAFARANDSVACQSNYLRALELYKESSVSIIEGKYYAKEARAHEAVKGQSPGKSRLIDIWKLEEKQSDVSLALHAFSDAVHQEVDHVVFVTNDTDLVPALKMIREKTNAVVGLIIPTKDDERRVNASLDELSHWTRSDIKEWELRQSQLPSCIRGGNKTIFKPLSWYPRPDLLIPIFNEAKRVKKSNGAAWKWLNEPSERFEGRAPVEMAENDTDAVTLEKYMESYAKEFEV